MRPTSLLLKNFIILSKIIQIQIHACFISAKEFPEQGEGRSFADSMNKPVQAIHLSQYDMSVIRGWV